MAISKFAACAALYVAGLLAAGTQANAAQAPAGQFFKLNVKSSFKAPFTDCWAFSSNGQFIVSRGSLGSFPYQLTGLNTVAGHFQAIWQGHVSIGFSGAVSGTSVTGDGVDANDRTYSFTGTKVSSCAGARDVSGFATR